ncbi:hypothetical protein K450DRAFT_263764 [Umbelopsis ramanniana AG]|uniref:Uncharacterized protein n=1 Tax=Umbelopsis ramanniana AG TaxID=1314678 RepID=A0AAD5DZB5_UMBRA|nr:uncharacterized protein K450DRAFT_263764 [Umbelopsis ramanniana AG]KAI8575016.1 hypothetical protein K450DRAFT_263764 [Umbelopsis ramanniana AG]
MIRMMTHTRKAITKIEYISQQKFSKSSFTPAKVTYMLEHMRAKHIPCPAKDFWLD